VELDCRTFSAIAWHCVSGLPDPQKEPAGEGRLNFESKYFSGIFLVANVMEPV
jgi:hypothetical protein